MAYKARDIQLVIMDYFSTLFTSMGPANYTDVLAYVTTKVYMVMRCMELPTFLFVINGLSSDFMVSNSGLCQGHLISPYLFLFVTKSLIQLL